jgi:hypothetical protein
MELLIAAGTAGAGEVISAAGGLQRIGGAINALADTLRAVDVRFPLVPVGASEMGMLGIKGVQNPFVRSVPVEYTGGEFSIIDFAGYPEIPGVPRPTGPARLLQGEEYLAARAQADAANSALRAANPEAYAGKQIHEILPVKFGGDPVNVANKVALTPTDHYRLNAYFLRLQRYLEGKGR